MKKIWPFILMAVLTLIAVLFLKTTSAFSLQIPAVKTVRVPVDTAAVTHLSEAITYRTVSQGRGLPVDTAAFKSWQAFLKRTYPLVDSILTGETFSEFSLLYTWEGSNPKLRPILLLGHQDVVSVPDSALWTHPPFSGTISKGFVWGRGTLDDKTAVIQMHEAIELLLKKGYRPERTIIFAFGHDEETGGEHGAKVLADILQKRGVRAEFILDEGMAITRDMVPMIDRPVALIGTSEKGQMFVRMQVDMDGGHASTPSDENAVTVLNKAIDRAVTKYKRTEFPASVKDFFRYIGPEMPIVVRIFFANDWLFGSVIRNIYEDTPSGKALVNTTVAPSILKAGSQANLLPHAAEAVLNIRICPGETSTGVLSHLKKVIGDERVRLTTDEWLNEPSTVSSPDTYGFAKIQYTLAEVYPGILTAPTLMLSASDSRNYAALSSNVYRFAPIQVSPLDNARIHGTDERIDVSDYEQGIIFYFRLIQNCGH